jgi:Ca2+-binding EF-hand superfamily protein
LKQVYENLGKTANEKELKAMVAEVKGPLNFQAMLQLYWDKLSGTDDEPVLAAAFKLFDSNGSGFIKTDALKEILTQEGRPSDRLSDAEVIYLLLINKIIFQSNLFKIVRSSLRRCTS